MFNFWPCEEYSSARPYLKTLHVFFLTFLKDELARLRRQSVSRVPTVRASATIQEGSMKEDISNAKNLHEPTSLSNSTEGCFLHFGRALPSPTILNNKVNLILSWCSLVFLGYLQQQSSQ